ncbi:nitric oxide synthase-like protein [Gigantopelta aegis]|uniref:nitric oxide synthase-like protein n=1 Tax=Gigantopelta aegis TaxID=1735272 RepID=UPI001B88DD21|nr:nitric oxide synthase-like protein [Gigantopelta aegis]
MDETVLDNGSLGSPKIVLTSPNSPGRKSIEIFQDNDEITVVIKGDVRIKNEGSEPVSPNKVVLNSPTSQNQSGNSMDNILNGHLSEDESKKTASEFRKSPSVGRRLSDRRGSSASPKKYTKLRNLLDEKTTVDLLHQKSHEEVPCTPERCMGSIMAHMTKRPPGVPRPKDEVIVDAKDFIDQYYQSIKRLNTPAHLKRMEEAMSSIESTGTYDLTTSELTFGAKTAWRNAPRCIGRIQWSKLQVFDARHITTARGMFEAICNHIKYGTNKGNLRSSITIFPQRTDPKKDYRVWNAQLIRYAGYRQPDGSVIGDPANCDFTEVCIKMGWKPKGGMFDILPLVLSAGGHDPEMFEIPSELILEVPIKHPKYPWFADLGYKWYALPAVSMMVFDCGGIEFPASPFNGWYMGTEIAARDFCDVTRYNVTETVAKKMGLDTRKTSSLWQDRACVEVNIAVLYSYQSAGVSITDHHAASDSFIKHLENEQRLRGGCPADWVWVVPPISGSLTQVFHQEMLMYKLKPSYEYQEDAWKSHVWKKDRERTSKSFDRPKRKFGFKELARAVKFSAKLMGKALAKRVKCVILYATETGKSERFARTTCEIFKHAFDAKVMCMDEYDVIHLEHEALVLIISSTFGNGDPPENGETFANALLELKNADGSNSENMKTASYIRMSSLSEKEVKMNGTKPDADDNLTMDSGPLGNVRYSVFALGSRAYPNFCAFGHYLDNVLHELSAERIVSVGEGDEICGQEESFRNWAQEVFKAACETFCLGDDVNMSEATDALSNTDLNWSAAKFRITPLEKEKEVDICEALSKLHSKSIRPCKLVERIQLQSTESPRQTILVKLDHGGAVELLYHPGDHAGIYAANPPELVNAILARLHNAPPPDQVIQVEILQEKTTPLGTTKAWTPFEKMPRCSLRTAFTRYLDVTTPPSQSLLQLLATQASRDADREHLEQLATVSQVYEEWKYDKTPNLLEVLDEFPSLKVPPSLIMTQLPLLQQRFYSISSSPLVTPDQIHATIAVVRYRTQDGAGPMHEGVCSGWLNRCEIGEMVPCTARAAPTFRMPEDMTLPILLVGPGTGIAPFRSFWQQRKIYMEMHSVPTSGDKKGWGEFKLYYGCRKRTEDYIFEAELKQMKADGVLTDYYTALSRQPGMPKVYVQDLLLQNAADVFNAIVKCGGHFYVCGDVAMASDVTTTLEKILQKEGDMTTENAKKFILKLRDASRFHEDIFGVSIQRNFQKTERSRDQSQRAMQYINSTGKVSKPDAVKTIATPIRTVDRRYGASKPKAPTKNVFMKHRIEPEGESGNTAMTSEKSGKRT